MKGLIIRSSYGTYDDYTENNDALWIRDEEFNWESLYAEFKRLNDGIRQENQGKKKDRIPEITLTQFLYANDFIPIFDFEEQMN